MRPPRQERSAATVDAIDEAVDAIVAKDGVAAVTAKAVAIRAGVSPGTLYQYFRSRDALLASWELRAMQRSVQELSSLMRDAVARGLPLDEIVWAVSHRAVLLVFRTLWTRSTGAVGFATTLGERQSVVDAIVEFLASSLERSPSLDRLLPTDLRLAMRVALYAVVFTPYPAALRGSTADEQEAMARLIADMISRFLIRPVQPSAVE